MIESALRYLVGLAKPTKQEVNGRAFILHNTYQEVLPDDTVSQLTRGNVGGPLHLGTVASLIDLLNSDLCTESATFASPRRVVIDRKGIVTTFRPGSTLSASRFDKVSDRILVPFVELWTGKSFSFDGFKDFLDEFKGKIDAEALIRDFMRQPAVVERKEVKIEDRGAVTVFKFSATKNIEGAKLELPKEITIDLPTGTREFEIPQRFIFRVLINDGSISFSLKKIENDGSWEMLLATIKKILTEELPNDLILEGV